MLFRQFVDDDLGCASYLIGDESSGEAVVVDPAYAIEQYLEAAKDEGLRIVRVLETHTHADHVSGHGRLALEHGFQVCNPFRGRAGVTTSTPLADGDEIDVGSCPDPGSAHSGPPAGALRIRRVRHRAADEPWLTLTGDSLFVGDAARPDLAVEATEGARDLYASLNRLLELSDGVEIYPGHVAGSLCGAGMSSKRSSTIGFERSFNRTVGDRVGGRVRRGVDSRGRAASEHGTDRGAEPRAVRRRRRGDPACERRGGGAILDVRSAEEFAAGHAAGAFNVAVASGGFPTKAAFALPAGERVVVHAASDEQVRAAARGLRSVGILDLSGYVIGPPAQESPGFVDVNDLRRSWSRARRSRFVDVREPHERDEGYIPGSRNIPYRLVREWVDDLEGGKPVVTICSSGSRAAVAASVLSAAAGIEPGRCCTGASTTGRKTAASTVSFRRCGS